MKSPQYTLHTFSVGFCNTLAFKDGKTFGPCLKYQAGVKQHQQSLNQSKKIWGQYSKH